MITDFRQQLNELKNAADKEEYAKQLANIFLTGNLDLKTILLMAMDYGAQSRWISVEDELPPTSDKDDESDDYLIVDSYGDKNVGYYNKMDELWFSCDGDILDVTHWMAMPQRPVVSEMENTILKGGEE